MNKKEQIKALVVEMLNETNKEMINDIDKILDSGCVNIDDWCETRNRMIMPKSIITALLEKESRQYDARGTSFEKEVRKTIKKHYGSIRIYYKTKGIRKTRLVFYL